MSSNKRTDEPSLLQSRDKATDGQANQPNTRRTLLTGLGVSAALAAWHKPLINAVVTPAHAQTSVLPEDVCAMIVVGNVLTGPVSGTTVPPVCSVTFDVLSGDAAASLTITNIDAGTLPADVTVDVQDLGAATSTTGPRVVWRGPAADAPFCTDVMPTDDVTFTITATCAAAPMGGTFDQTFSLNDILTP